MYGSIIGDIVGSRFEFSPIKTKDFELFAAGSKFTDDTVMSVAMAMALVAYKKIGGDFQELLIEQLQFWGQRFPNAGYGGMFYSWIHDPDPAPYNSYGNGSAMRVGAVGLYAETLLEAFELAKRSAEVTHNHPEGIKGAQATAVAVYLAKTGHHDKQFIRDYINHYFYPLDFSLDEIRDTYRFDVTCQGTVPVAITAFYESTSFEDAVRNAISLGGDSDTLGAIVGAIAWPYYYVNNKLELTIDMHNIFYDATKFIPMEFRSAILEFYEIVDPYKSVREQLGLY